MSATRRVAVVTGASSGIGLATATALATAGWRVIGLGRDPGRCADAERHLRAASPFGSAEMIRADLSRLAESAGAAKVVKGLTDRIDLLVNNAGGIARQKEVTAEGLEQLFAANHLGPFLFTTELLPLLKRTAADAPAGSVRIVNTASDASEMIPGLDFDDLQGLANDRPGLAYCRAKLANVLFARGLAQRLAGDGIVAHAMHPGYVDSNFITYADDQAQARMRSMTGQTPEEGADTLVWLATDDEPGRTSGGYYHKRAPREPNPSAYDNHVVARLWDESEKLVAPFREA